MRALRHTGCTQAVFSIQATILMYTWNLCADVSIFFSNMKHHLGRQDLKIFPHTELSMFRHSELIWYSHYECGRPHLSVTWSPLICGKKLTNVPRSRSLQMCEHTCRQPAKLAQDNTPIERWPLSSVPDEFEVYIKRDDLTGSVLSGNKVRALEFVFADAIQQGCTSVIAYGGIQSNNLRAIAVMASTLGMQAHLLLRTDEDPDSLACRGNYLIQRMMGVQRYLIPKSFDLEKDIFPRMKQLADKIRKETGEKAYPIIHVQNQWLYGYVNVFHEMMNQGLVDSYTDIVIASSGCGSLAGLIVANHLTGNKVRIHNMVTGDILSVQHEKINKMLRYAGLQKADGTGLRSEDACDAVEGPIGAGYAMSTPEELDFIKNVAHTTGILLGPVYSGKAAYHLVKQLNTNPQRFKGKKILFVHTGGMFELFDGSMDNAFDKENKAQIWKEITDDETISS